MSEFNKKIVIITGANGGIGKSITSKFIENGAKVYALDKNFKRSGNSENCKKIKLDLRNKKFIDKIINKISKKESKIDILINCAGVSLKLKKNNLEKYWNETIAVNLTGAFFLSLGCLKLLKKSNYPSIINITSLTSKLAMSSNPAYNASKAALRSLGISFAMDFQKYKIRVNNVCPGYIKTEMTKKSYSNKKERSYRINRMMNDDYGETQDIAEATLFLASEKSKYINASDLVVDGGFLTKGI